MSIKSWSKSSTNCLISAFLPPLSLFSEVPPITPVFIMAGNWIIGTIHFPGKTSLSILSPEVYKDPGPAEVAALSLPACTPHNSHPDSSILRLFSGFFLPTGTMWRGGSLSYFQAPIRVWLCSPWAKGRWLKAVRKHLTLTKYTNKGS